MAREYLEGTGMPKPEPPDFLNDRLENHLRQRVVERQLRIGSFG